MPSTAARFFDIKPVMTGFLPYGTISEPEWAREIMKSYW